MPDLERMTIDELAQRAGTASSTVRLYQTRGLLPPPTRQGRVGYYGAGHLARLRLVAQLQEEGFSLASIGSLVDAWEQGRSLEDVLGLEAQVTAVWGTEPPLRLRPEELAARFPDRQLSAALFARTVALGLLGIEGDHFVVHNPRFLEIGAELAALGLPLDEIVEEYARLVEVTATIAGRFTDLFQRHLWDAGRPADIGDLVSTLQRLSALAEGIVGLTLRQSLRRAAATFLISQKDLDELRPLAAAAGLELLPLDGGGGLAGDVQDDPVDRLDLVGDPRGDPGQDVVGEP